MSVKQGGLGRNLSALLSKPQTTAAVDAVPIDVSPQTVPILHLQAGKYQPRRDMDDAGLAELAQSIRQQGLLQPIVVRKIAQERYEIIAGERRFRACQLNGMSDVAVVIRQVDDETAMVMALVENLQREGLNVVDEARAMQRLVMEFSLTHQAIAEVLAKSRAHVSNCLRLLSLHPDVLRLLEHGDLDMGHARSLLALDGSEQYEAAKSVIAKDLSVRETEALVAKMKSGQHVLSVSTPIKNDIPHVLTQQLDQLSVQLQKKVKIKAGKLGNGKLIIHYQNMQDLENMLNELMITCQ